MSRNGQIKRGVTFPSLGRYWCAISATRSHQYGLAGEGPGGGTSAIPRNEHVLVSEALRFLMKDKEAELSADDVATLNSYKGSLDSATNSFRTG